MGRHSAVIAAFVVFLGACGDDGEESAGDDARTGVIGPMCPDAEVATPELMPAGEVIELSDNGAGHVACASYARTPAASGAHFDAWQNCGFYNEPIRDQTAVHSLEHGAVWIAYQPDLGADQVATIEARFEGETHLLAAPYPGLQNPIVLTAWTRQLAVDDWADPAVESFLDSFTGRRSSTAPEAGVSCEGAVGIAPDDPDANFAEIFDQVVG